MVLPIKFQSLDRIDGKEGRSKLIHSDSELYQHLHALKSKIKQEYEVGSDRMDLHIELTKERRDPDFRQKTEQVQDETVDMSANESWGYLGRAFVLWTPETPTYGRTHITIAFFGSFPRPEESVLVELAQERFAELAS